MFLLYGLFVLFALGFLGMFICAKEKHYILLIPVFIALPTFLYLFDPNISLDHPWMLRRYLFSLFPTFLFSAVMGIALLLTQDKNLPVANPHGKRLFFASIIILGLALLQYPAWSTGILFAENRTLLNQVATLSQEFSDKDLVLVDRNVTSDGFAMLTGPAQFLYGKNMVYFFNPTDIATLDTAPFARIYLLVPEGDQMRYVSVFGHRLVFNKTITFTQERFEYLSLEENAPLRLPEKILYTTNNLLFQIY
ncbi:MAG TPA: hypothetical protein VJH89_01190, partial [Patescibacteria group bacterium]|nr:hypothetical protein [Patescibacteria group bacterium]